MSRYDHHDILLELIELGREQKSDISQQLLYYRASVYKAETGALIESKVEQLLLVSELIGDELLRDAFRDYEVMRSNGPHLLAPGECLLSARVTNLLAVCQASFTRLQAESHGKAASERKEFTQNVQKLRSQLLSMCPQGSRQWSFFHSL